MQGKAFLTQILSKLNTPVFLKDREHALIFVNEAHAKLCGFTVEQMTGKTDFDLFPAEQAKIFWRKDEEAFASDEHIENEEYLTDGAGKRHTLKTKKFAFVDESQERFLVGIIEDITQVRDLETRVVKEQSERERLLQVFLSAEHLGKTGGWEYNVVNGDVFWSDEVYRIHGVPLGTSIPIEECVKFYVDDGQYKIGDLFKRAVSHGESYEAELPFCSANGERKWVRTLGQPIIEDARVTRIVGALIDITQQRKDMLELQEAQERLTLATNSAKLGLWDWHIKSGKTIVNDRWRSMLGYESSDIIREIVDFSVLVHPEDKPRLTKAIEAHFAGDAEFSVDIRLRRTDGTYQWVCSRGLVVERAQDGSPERMTGVLMDLTEQKAVEEVLTRARDAAESTSKLKSHFVANMSHEIRTPLNGVLGMAELLGETALTISQKELVGNLTLSARSLLTVINDILDFSKIEAGKLDIIARRFSLIEFVGRVTTMISGQYLEKRVSLDFIVDPSLPENLFGDDSRLQQIALNFLSNSLKFTPAGGSVSCQIFRFGDNAEGMVSLSVADSGIGIKPENLAVIFDSFVQGDTGVTRQYGGTGLGLSIAKQLATMMGGKIEVSSVCGYGSTFAVHLPLATESLASLAEVPRTERPIDLNLIPKNLSILVAEDNLINQKVIRSLLEKAGHRVVTVGNGEEAVAQSEQQLFNLIFMDVQMPVMDGESSTKIIRAGALNRAVPIIAFTAHTIRGDEERFKLTGMDGYVPKPINRQQLFLEMARVLSAERVP